MIKKKIIFMGTPKISSIYLDALFNNNFNIIAVFSQPPRKQGRGMEIQESPVQRLAKLNNIDTYTPPNLNSDKVKNLFESLKPDLVVVMGYGIKLPSFILKLPEFGCINIHVSLLPRWRGAAPIEYALLNGDSKTGITIFKLIEKMDAGPIIKYKSVKIDPNINKFDLTSKLNLIGTELLNFTLPIIFNNKITFIKQDNNLATYASKISTDMRKLNFDESLHVIKNKIRAFSPTPSAWFLYNKERIKIIETDFILGDWVNSKILNKQFHIGCNDGKICPKIIQREGKNPMEIKEFLRGFKFEVGDQINE